MNAQENHIHDFAQLVNVVISLLPHTNETLGILNGSFFNAMPDASYLINVGRGTQLNEEDLIKAMHTGKIKTAFLDVFQQEPLHPTHPFWDHPQIIITPHIASITDPFNAAKIIAENYLRLKSDQSLLFEVNRDLGY